MITGSPWTAPASAAWPTIRPPTCSTSAAGTRASSTAWPARRTRRPGETLSQCSPADPEHLRVSPGTARSDMLWEATNSDTDTIFLLDPATCETVRALAHPDGGGFGGAGIETRRRRQPLDRGPEQRQRLSHRERPADLQRRAVAVGRPDARHRRDRRQPAADGHCRHDRPGPRRLPRDRGRPDERSRQRQHAGPGDARRPGVPAGRQRRRRRLRRSGHGRPLRRRPGVLRPAASATSASATRSTNGRHRAAPTAIRSTRISGGHVGLSVRRPERHLQGRLCRSRSSSSRRPGRGSSASRSRAPQSCRTSTSFAAAGGQHVASTGRSSSRSPTACSTSGSLAQRGDKPIVNAILVTEMPPGSPGN